MFYNCGWTFLICQNSFLPRQQRRLYNKADHFVRYHTHTHRWCTNHMFNLQKIKNACTSNNNNTLLINIRLNLQNGLRKTTLCTTPTRQLQYRAQDKINLPTWRLKTIMHHQKNTVCMFFSFFKDDHFCCFLLCSLSTKRKQNIYWAHWWQSPPSYLKQAMISDSIGTNKENITKKTKRIRSGA